MYCHVYSYLKPRFNIMCVFRCVCLSITKLKGTRGVEEEILRTRCDRECDGMHIVREQWDQLKEEREPAAEPEKRMNSNMIYRHTCLEMLS